MDPILSALDRQFLQLDTRSRTLLALIPEDSLFKRPRQVTNPWAMFSCGEYILRSAAMVEKTFGGITTRLWDDPFEWTLPEKLSTHVSVTQYLDEVDETRRKGFSYFASDDDLRREMPAPGKLRSIAEVLFETLSTASHYQGRSFAVFQMLSDERLPRL